MCVLGTIDMCVYVFMCVFGASALFHVAGTRFADRASV